MQTQTAVEDRHILTVVLDRHKHTVTVVSETHRHIKGEKVRHTHKLIDREKRDRHTHICTQTAGEGDTHRQ